MTGWTEIGTLLETELVKTLQSPGTFRIRRKAAGTGGCTRA